MYIDFHVFNKKKIFILGFIEAFFTNITIYSRAFLLISSAYLRGLLLLIQTKKNFLISPFSIFKFVFIICIFFLISFYSGKQLRSSFFYKSNNNINSVSTTEAINEIKHLSINRWVGIDALLSVSQSNKLNFSFFLSAWKERKEVRNNSFYINHFFNSFKYSDDEKANEILFWQNKGDDYDVNLTEKTIHAKCNHNFGVWARFAYALNAQSEYVCIFDDDTIPGKKWFENCLSTIEKHDGLLGTIGVLFNNNQSYGNNTRVG
jgi:hypothetical protein